MLVIVGTGFCACASTTKLTALLVPPPGVGENTVIGLLPAVLMSLAAMLAVSWVELTKVVGFELPLMRTSDPATKPVPFTVRVKAASPAVLLVGLMLEMTGVGFCAALIVNVKAFDVWLAVTFLTETAALPAASTKEAGTTAVSCVALTKVVANGEPCHKTWASFAKLVPFAVNVNCAAPAVVALGEMLVSVGALPAPLPTVNDTPDDVPPPGAGVWAVKANVALLARSPTSKTT